MRPVHKLQITLQAIFIFHQNSGYSSEAGVLKFHSNFQFIKRFMFNNRFSNFLVGAAEISESKLNIFPNCFLQLYKMAVIGGGRKGLWLTKFLTVKIAVELHLQMQYLVNRLSVYFYNYEMTLVISVDWYSTSQSTTASKSAASKEKALPPHPYRWLFQVRIEMQFATHALLINNPGSHPCKFH